MRSSMIGAAIFFAFILGCATSAVVSSRLSVPPAHAGTNPQQWEYVCASVYGSKPLQKWANQLGQQGWELAGAAGGLSARGSGLAGRDTASYVWCFKRALP